MDVRRAALPGRSPARAAGGEATEGRPAPTVYAVADRLALYAGLAVSGLALARGADEWVMLLTGTAQLALAWRLFTSIRRWRREGLRPGGPGGAVAATLRALAGGHVLLPVAFIAPVAGFAAYVAGTAGIALYMCWRSGGRAWYLVPLPQALLYFVGTTGYGGWLFAGHGVYAAPIVVLCLTGAYIYRLFGNGRAAKNSVASMDGSRTDDG